MSLGDVPAWVAAVAAWAGVVVNALIVFVALSPIRTAKRQRAARGRLVAAYLMIPVLRARSALKLGSEHLAFLLNADPNVPAWDVSFALVRQLPETIRGLLNSFDVSEAAYLDEKMGEHLAQSLGILNAIVVLVPEVLVLLTELREAKGLAECGDSVTSQKVQALRERAHKVAAPLPGMLNDARSNLGVFTDYCRHLSLLHQGGD